MNFREALQVLSNGGEVGDVHGDVWAMNEGGYIYCCSVYGLDEHDFRQSGPFHVRGGSTTDEELIAEIERRSAYAGSNGASDAYRECANMLRTRKVKP